MSWDVLSLGTFCPWDLMSEDVLSWDVLSWEVLSVHQIYIIKIFIVNLTMPTLSLKSKTRNEMNGISTVLIKKCNHSILNIFSICPLPTVLFHTK